MILVLHMSLPYTDYLNDPEPYEVSFLMWSGECYIPKSHEVMALSQYDAIEQTKQAYKGIFIKIRGAIPKRISEGQCEKAFLNLC